MATRVLLLPSARVTSSPGDTHMTIAFVYALPIALAAGITLALIEFWLLQR